MGLIPHALRVGGTRFARQPFLLAGVPYDLAVHPMLRYYAQTWWLWLLLVVAFALIGYYVTALFFIFIPFLLAYSVYFGLIRTSEERDRQ